MQNNEASSFRAHLIAEGIIIPADHGQPYLPLDDKGRAEARRLINPQGGDAEE